MTLTNQAPPAAQRLVIAHVGVPGLRLVRSEIRKMATTNAWWLFGIASLVFTGLALWINMAEAAQHIARARDAGEVFQPGPGMSSAEITAAKAEFAQLHDLHLQAVNAAGNIFTSGQFFGLLLVILRAPASRVAALVAAYIGAAYWFTASTSFANPAAVVGRMFSDSFAGIAPASAPGFIVAELIGAALAVAVNRCLSPPPGELRDTPSPTSTPAPHV